MIESVVKKATIIGAGMAGLGCSYQLSKKNPDLDVLILEKSKKVGGRATSNSRYQMIYDHGANYFSFEGLSSPETLKQLIFNELPASDIKQSEKWTYSSGILRLGELLQQNQNLKVQLQSQVTGLTFNPIQKLWIITFQKDEKEQKYESNFICLTPPAPQIIEIIRKSDYERKEQLLKIFDKVVYSKQIVLVIAFNKDLILPYAFLLNSDREHAISWVSVEQEKQGHIPKGKSLLVCQMSPDFSNKFYEEENEILKQIIKTLLINLIPQIKEQMLFESMEFSWIKKWKFSLPLGASISPQELLIYQNDGIYFAGDFLIGKGRVLQSLEKGINAADQLRANL